MLQGVYSGCLGLLEIHLNPESCHGLVRVSRVLPSPVRNHAYRDLSFSEQAACFCPNPDGRNHFTGNSWLTGEPHTHLPLDNFVAGRKP